MFALHQIHKPKGTKALLISVFVFNFIQSCHSCSGGGPSDEYRVMRKTDGEGKQLVVAVDEDARLYCTTNVQWKKCLWKPPRNGVKELRCEFTNGPENKITCDSFPEVHYDTESSKSENHKCAIVVQDIQEHHEGNWRCEFELDLPDGQYEEPVIIKDRVKLLARGYRYP